jgi:hypothetical protein
MIGNVNVSWLQHGLEWVLFVVVHLMTSPVLLMLLLSPLLLLIYCGIDPGHGASHVQLALWVAWPQALAAANSGPAAMTRLGRRLWSQPGRTFRQIMRREWPLTMYGEVGVGGWPVNGCPLSRSDEGVMSERLPQIIWIQYFVTESQGGTITQRHFNCIRF